MEKNEYSIEELVKMIDEQLQGHDISFEEYLLLRAIHEFENRDFETMKSLEEKGLITDGKVTSRDKIDEYEKTMYDYFFTDKDVDEVFDRHEVLKLLALSLLFKNGRFY